MVQDPEYPTITLPVDAADPGKAILFVDGLALLVGLTVANGRIEPAPRAEVEDLELSGVETNPVLVHVHSWVDEVPPLQGAVDGNGRLVS